MLKIENVSKIFDGTPAVKNLTINIDKGMIYALAGPNGSGKTTTIKMITGLLKPTSGTILINNHSITKSPTEAKRITGYIPDEPFIYGKLTGREILMFTARLYSIEKSKIESKINRLLQIYDLNDIADSLFDDYSRGNKQKFVILSALIHDPEILIFDEPIVGLDVQSIITTKDLLLKFKKKGGTILISTHTLSFAEQIADKVGFLKNGVLIADDYLSNYSESFNQENLSLEDIYKNFITSKKYD